MTPQHECRYRLRCRKYVSLQFVFLINKLDSDEVCNIFSLEIVFFNSGTCAVGKHI